MAKYKIVYDSAGCIGAAACAAVAPDVWKVGDDGKAHLLIREFDEKDLQKNLDAAKACPVNVIHIEDENGKRLI
ncbi:MAG: ferredoxin [Candidatus Micrarchaeota archaeon]